MYVYIYIHMYPEHKTPMRSMALIRVLTDQLLKAEGGEKRMCWSGGLLYYTPVN